MIFSAWTETLSKRNLRTYNNNLKSRQQQQPASQMDTKPPMTSDGVGGILAFGGGGSGCKSCALIPGYQEMPAIISACLVRFFCCFFVALKTEFIGLSIAFI